MKRLKLVKNGNIIEHGASRTVKKYMQLGQGNAIPDLSSQSNLTSCIYKNLRDSMSFELLRVALKARNMTSNEKLILLTLADHANEENICWLLMSTIAAEACMSKSSARKAIASLEKMDLVRRQKFTGRATTYHVNLRAPHYGAQTASIECHNLPLTGGEEKCIICGRVGCTRPKASYWVSA